MTPIKTNGKKYFEDVINSKQKFIIKPYQRQYEATEKWLDEITRNFLSCMATGNSVHLLNVLLKVVMIDGDEMVSIVDGQQRIITYFIGYIRLVHEWEEKVPNSKKLKDIKARIADFFEKGGIKYSLSSRDTKLKSLLDDRSCLNNAERIENEWVKKTYIKWGITFDIAKSNQFGYFEILSTLSNTRLLFNYLDPEDDEETMYITSNKNRNQMCLYGLCGPLFMKYPENYCVCNDVTNPIEFIVKKYDEFSKDKLTSMNSGKCYRLDWVIRNAVEIESITTATTDQEKLYLPSLSESKINSIATDVSNFVNKKKINLLKLCEKYWPKMQYLLDPDEFIFDLVNNENQESKDDTVAKRIKACRSMAKNGAICLEKSVNNG